MGTVTYLCTNLKDSLLPTFSWEKGLNIPAYGMYMYAPLIIAACIKKVPGYNIATTSLLLMPPFLTALEWTLHSKTWPGDKISECLRRVIVKLAKNPLLIRGLGSVLELKHNSFGHMLIGELSIHNVKSCDKSADNAHSASLSESLARTLWPWEVRHLLCAVITASIKTFFPLSISLTILAVLCATLCKVLYHRF